MVIDAFAADPVDTGASRRETTIPRAPVSKASTIPLTNAATWECGVKPPKTIADTASRTEVISISPVCSDDALRPCSSGADIPINNTVSGE